MHTSDNLSWNPIIVYHPLVLDLPDSYPFTTELNGYGKPCIVGFDCEWAGLHQGPHFNSGGNGECARDHSNYTLNLRVPYATPSS